jgi:eukaryotic-like serine/threonine-protein kinase
MPFVPTLGAEPIAGYQLLEKLGTGGYGAVWKSTAPGGLTKAIKFVFGDVGSHQAEQELKALRRIKEVRHPFLLSLERFEIVDGQLFIVTELADKSLLDRFNECRQSGLRGVPREELLGYLRDAAEALDYMGETHGLQHLDIKPQNLLLVGGRIKVADFGLVKDLVGTSVTATGGVTPIYATPEAFDGRVSRFSDQYSLAVVYQEMLTGVRPFPGTTVLQLAAQHMSSRPLLDPLPPYDRPVIARALSKVPESRYPTCRELMEQLLRVRGPAATLPLSVEETPPPARSIRDPRETLRPRTRSGSESESVLGIPTEVGLGPLADAPEPQPQPLSPWQISAPKSESAIELRPTLFLGIGGLACATLKRLRQRLHRRFGKLSAVPIFRMLLVDTDRAELRAARQGKLGEALEPQETLLTPLRPTEQYRDQSKALLRWLDRRWLYGIPRSNLTEGRRPLGALALVDNAEAVLTRIRDCLSQITSPEAKARTASATDMRLRDESPRIFILGSIAGATGSGMLLGMAYAVRQVLEEMRLSSEGVCSVMLHATSQKPSEVDVSQLNAFATLNELYHYSLADKAYPGNPEHGLAPFAADHPPFHDAYLVQLGDQLSKSEVDAATDLVAEYLHLDAATSSGAFLDQYRYSTHPLNCEREGNPTLRSFGLFRISFPRQQLERLATNLFCHDLVVKWPGDAIEQPKEQIERDTQRQIEALGLEEEPLATRLHSAAEALLGEDPETYFPKLAAQCLPSTAPPANASAQSSQPKLGPIDAVLGLGASPSDGTVPPASALEKSLQEQAKEFGNQLGCSIVEWMLEIVEDPHKRLKAADIAGRWVAKHLQSATESARTKCTQMQIYRNVLREQIALGKTSGKGSGIRWLPKRLQSEVSGKANARLLEYCWTRLGEIVLESTEVALGAAMQCVYPFTQDLVLCRQRLAQFAALFPVQAKPSKSSGNQASLIPNLVELLPGRSNNLPAAAAMVVNNLPPDLLRDFDENFQAEVLNQQGGLWSMVSGAAAAEIKATRRGPSSLAFWDMVSRNSDLAENLKEKLLARVRPLILTALKDIDVANLFLQSHEDPEQAEHALLAHVHDALPRVRVPSGWQHLVLALPKRPAAVRLSDMVKQRYSEVPTTVLESDDDIVFYFESAQIPLQQLADSLIADAPERAEMAQKVMTRVDVSWSFFPAGDS